MITGDILEWARATPDKTAVIHNGRALTYRNLANRSLAMIGYFQTLELQPGSTAVIVVRSLLNSWIAVFALRALGINTIAAESLLQMRRLDMQGSAYVIVDAGEKQGKADQTHMAPGQRLIDMSQVPSALPEAAWAELAGPCGGHILYTSGTTGQFKKVFYGGDKAERVCEHVADRFALTQDTVFQVLFFPLYSVAGFFYPMATWQTGGCVVLDQTAGAIRGALAHEITMLFASPNILMEIVHEAVVPPGRRGTFTICVAGGFLSARLAQQIRESITHRIKYYYGATECIDILRSDVENEDELHWLEPAGWRTVQILKPDGSDCDVGEEGELAVRLTDIDCGAYLGDPVTSAAVFRDGYFHPGDLAIRRVDGRIRILGRVSEVLNVAGRKIAVGPVEERLQRILDGRPVCVFAQLDSAGDDEVVVAIETGSVPSDAQVREVADLLRGFHKIKVTVVLRFPRTATAMAKIDRHALRRLLNERPA
jgi:acyl-coenzyme A synthetase/AMP-(fatty) acid ligase